MWLIFINGSIASLPINVSRIKLLMNKQIHDTLSLSWLKFVATCFATIWHAIKFTEMTASKMYNRIYGRRDKIDE